MRIFTEFRNQLNGEVPSGAHSYLTGEYFGQATFFSTEISGLSWKKNHSIEGYIPAIGAHI